MIGTPPCRFVKFVQILENFVACLTNIRSQMRQWIETKVELAVFSVYSKFGFYVSSFYVAFLLLGHQSSNSFLLLLIS